MFLLSLLQDGRKGSNARAGSPEAEAEGKKRKPRKAGLKHSLRRAIGRLESRRRRGRSKREPDIYVTSTLPVQGQTVAVFVSLAKPATPLGWIQRSLRTFAHDDLVSVSFDGKSVPSYPLKRSKTKRDYPM